ncbi:uncharacterized protein RAG0_10068 [Rhynchosporium agropyri]|uniref:Uncharacterized protein n=1 Tax=Rhynchosporium agropyri TaxID=914238 RepID=A0A1E1KYB7_9HELO|nr:uncharacterized protein RAG0_10068 [Rhynchosporium agropyri]
MPSNYGRSANQPELALMHEVEKRQQLHPHSRPNASSLIPTKDKLFSSEETTRK